MGAVFVGVGSINLDRASNTGLVAIHRPSLPSVYELQKIAQLPRNLCLELDGESVGS
jgi:hypothetical protein